MDAFFTTGELEMEINKTNICLIPKKLGANRMQDFWPIGLSNVVYKIIAKILAKRLKKILPRLISETEAAFVHDRNIHDNILIAHEMLHALKSENKCAEEFLAIKTDISKAFDRVEWSFLERALKVLGFADEWVSLIMKCVSTVSYQVLINGHAYGNIIPSRGIRQGEPLSPYLFIICTEMLVRLLQKADKDKKLTVLKVARTAPSISHLFFANDSMFYCKEKDEEINHLMGLLKKYNLASGQRSITKSQACILVRKSDNLEEK